MAGPPISTPAATRTRATGSGGRCSIQLSYGGVQPLIPHFCRLGKFPQPATPFPGKQRLGRSRGERNDAPRPTEGSRPCSLPRECYNGPAMSSYPPTAYRLIASEPGDGATHMAIDEVVWRAVAEGGTPTLRLYAWAPPCLSLGRNQPVRDVNREAIAAAGHGLVRRPTGGRAILHTDELTYSVVIPLSDPRVRGGVLASCAQLSQGLVRALELLGVDNVTTHRRSTGSAPQEPVCFETAGEFEIVVGQKKLIGSAQMQGRGVLLQHGTLPLCGDIARICAFLDPPADPQRVRSRATTLEATLGRSVSWQEAAHAVAEGFASALNLQLDSEALTSRERDLVRQLRREKYASDTWTDRL
jgi:lipoate-protein ligase A